MLTGTRLANLTSLGKGTEEVKVNGKIHPMLLCCTIVRKPGAELLERKKWDDALAHYRWISTLASLLFVGTVNVHCLIPP